MKTVINLNDVVKNIYAVSALASMPEKSAYPLLHPGCHDALLRIVETSLGLVLSRIHPSDISRIGDDIVELTFDKLDDSKAAAAAVIISAYTSSVARLSAMNCGVDTINEVVINLPTEYFSGSSNRHKPLIRKTFV